MPRLDSPAVNSADCTSGPIVDQRNETRPQNNTCDRGAVEVQSGEETLQVCGLQAGQTYHFLATGAKIEINTLGDLTCLDVTITDAVHPMASPNIPAPYVAITTTPHPRPVDILSPSPCSITILPTQMCVSTPAE
ncbi:MAG: hypothetical protein IPL28_02885 [Chloroflexi bacterium]|nr:hypothetical protein [Chloroflexota bacterium]